MARVVSGLDSDLHSHIIIGVLTLLLEFLMPTDSLFVEILLIRSETQLLFNVQPSAKLQSKLNACDAALRYLRGNPVEFVRGAALHGKLLIESGDRRIQR